MTDTTSKLCAEIAAWCDAQGLKHESADEMAGEIAESIFVMREVQEITARNLARLETQHAYLTRFCERWEDAQAREDMARQLQAAGYSLEMVGGGALVWSRYTESLYAVITGDEGAELTPGEPVTLGVYDPADKGDSIVQVDFRTLGEAIKAAARLVP